MNVVFLDTSFLIAIMRTRDQHHTAALKWRKALNGPYVTTEYVLVELMDACAAMPLRRRGTEALRIIREDPNVRIIRASAKLFDDGLEMFRQHEDKTWSLTDCISFVVMRREGFRMPSPAIGISSRRVFGPFCVFRRISIHVDYTVTCRGWEDFKVVVRDDA